MNKSQLIDAIQQELGNDTTRKTAAAALNATLAAIAKAVTKEKVQIVGFGSFETRQRPARVGRTPRTGETVSIPASSVVTFKPAAALKGNL